MSYAVSMNNLEKYAWGKSLLNKYEWIVYLDKLHDVWSKYE